MNSLNNVSPLVCLKNENEHRVKTFTFKTVNDVPRFEKYDMAMIVFSGYGEKDDLIFPDNKIGLYNLWQSLLGHKCRELLQKPKVVIISVSHKENKKISLTSYLSAFKINI